MSLDSPRSNGARIELSVPVRRGTARRRGLFRARPRFAAGAGHHQSHRQRVLVFGTGRRRARLARKDFGATGWRAAEERVVITVDDDGPGIPPHALERIFERFYTDRPNQGFGQNSGLGLSISRQIVEAHGGKIWAENRPVEPASVRVGHGPTSRPTSLSGTALARASSSNCRRSRHERRSRACTLRPCVYGENGVLIRGPSGSGKSGLALALLARARSTGLFAALIGDDRIWIRRAGGRLIASGARDLAGVIERRMAGLLTVGSESAAVVRLIVELSEPGRAWPRLPDDPGPYDARRDRGAAVGA